MNGDTALITASQPANAATSAGGSSKLRILAARVPDDPVLAELIGELTMRSEEFASLWAGHPVANHQFGRRRLCHPEVGELETAELADGSGHQLVLYSAAPGSRAHTALQLLKLATARHPAGGSPGDRQ